ncbi:MAG: hypothetical protein U9Q81_17595 [Pseudomonadota bacterium]|nr:hypothetical protein [Pseudomonadota bacterium]
MTKRLRFFIKGIGSILDIAPEPRVYRHTYKDGDLERLQGDFVRVADDVRVVVKKATEGRAFQSVENTSPGKVSRTTGGPNGRTRAHNAG